MHNEQERLENGLFGDCEEKSGVGREEGKREREREESTFFLFINITFTRITTVEIVNDACKNVHVLVREKKQRWLSRNNFREN